MIENPRHVVLRRRRRRIDHTDPPPSAPPPTEHPAVRIVELVTGEWARTLRFVIVLLAAIPVLAAVVWFAVLVTTT